MDVENGGDGADAAPDANMMSTTATWSTNPLVEQICVPFSATAAAGRSKQATISICKLRCDSPLTRVASLRTLTPPSDVHCCRRRPYKGWNPERFLYITRGSEGTIPLCPGYSGTCPSPPPCWTLILKYCLATSPLDVHARLCLHFIKLRFPGGSPVIAGKSPAFGAFWNWRVHESAAGWPEVHVTLILEDGDGVVLMWSGERAASDRKHTLDALVNGTMRDYLASLSPEKPTVTTRVSALGFLGWGVHDRSTPAGAGVRAGVGAGEAAEGRVVCATSSLVLATSSTP